MSTPAAAARGLLLAAALAAPPAVRSQQAIGGPTPPADTGLALPRVDIIYPRGGSLLDRELLSRSPTAEDSLHVREAVERRADFQAQWDREGPRYLRAAFDLAGRPFPYREVQVVLTVSRLTSMSSPLLVNVRGFLPGAEHPGPPDDFVEKVFHELMHHYVSPVRGVSALMKKYAGESQVTLNHLHVMALEVLVLRRLGQQAELDYLGGLYTSEPAPGDYARAWRIVNERESPEAFLVELRGMRP